MHTTLISATTTAEHLDDPYWVFVDCRFSLADTEAGWQAYQHAHLPGAVYAHLDNDLSGPPLTDVGRHPLPSPAALRALFGRLGINEKVQVVAYDDANGVIASRLWWMLRYMGHEATAVLDGGWSAWQTAALPTQSGVERNAPVTFRGEPRTAWLVQLSEVESGVPLLVDSRDEQRYRGELETIDPVAGHIPGASHFYYQRHWTENGRYLPPAEIRANLQSFLGATDPDEAVFYCGSGVSACVNLLALTHAGLGNGRLYVGSWSEWCRRKLQVDSANQSPS